MISPLMFKVLSFGGIAVAGTATATVGYKYSGSIANAFRSITGSSKKADATKYVYVLGKYTSAVDQTAADGKNLSYQDLTIYSITEPKDDAKGINLSTSFPDSAKVISPTSLKPNKHYFVKLSKNLYDSIKTSKTIKFADNSDLNKALGSFAILSGTASKGLDNKIQLDSSSLVVVKIAKKTDSISFQANQELTCKAYKFADAAEPLTQGQAKAIKDIANTDLTVGSFVLLDLKDNPQLLNELEHQVVVFQQGNSTHLAKGLVQQLLIGSIDKDLSSSKVFLVKSPQSSLTEGSPIDSAKHSYLLTKGGALHSTWQSVNPTANNYLCRVVDGTTKYDDPSCKLFAFDSTTAGFTFDSSKYEDTGTLISNTASLAAGKHQVVKLSKTLADKLIAKPNTIEPKIEIIHVDDKKAAWNNRLVSLTKVKELVADTETLQTIKTNSLLVRVKEALTTPTSEAPIAANKEFLCKIGTDGKDEICKLFTFNEAKNSNNLLPSDFLAMKTGAAINAALSAGNYYVLEFSSNKKDLTDVKNKQITLKLKDSPNAEVGKFVFDQFVYGQVGEAASLAKAKEAVFIVENDSASANKDENLAASYRCRFTAVGSDQENFDDTCQIRLLPTSATAPTIPSLASIKGTLPDLTAEFKLKNASPSPTYLRLTFDHNKLFNIDLNAFDAKSLSIDVIPQSGPSTEVFGTVKLLHNITEATFKGKAQLLLGKVTVAATNVPTTTSGQCVFVEANATPFACSVFKNKTAASDDSVAAKVSFSHTDHTINAADQAINKFILVDLGTANAKSYADLNGKSIVYHKSPASSGAAQDTDKVTMQIVGILGGAVAANKTQYFLLDPAAT